MDLKAGGAKTSRTGDGGRVALRAKDKADQVEKRGRDVLPQRGILSVHIELLENLDIAPKVCASHAARP